MDPELFAYLVSIDADNCHWAFRWVLLHFKVALEMCAFVRVRLLMAHAA